MSKRVPWKVRATGFVAAKSIQAWMCTLDYRVWFHNHVNDPCFGVEQPRIYVFWHEYILIPLYLRANCDVAMLLSRHKDADILAQVAGHAGFDCVRGSSNKGATAALLEMKRLGKHKHLAITPDGPRGPRRELAIGPVYLASRMGLPIVPIGFGFDRPWRMKSWDRFAVPRPFSRARGVAGPDFHVPDGLDREELERCRMDIESTLTQLTVEAEAWAASGETREGELRERARSRVLDPAQHPTPKPETNLSLPFANDLESVLRKSA